MGRSRLSGRKRSVEDFLNERPDLALAGSSKPKTAMDGLREAGLGASWDRPGLQLVSQKGAKSSGALSDDSGVGSRIKGNPSVKPAKTKSERSSFWRMPKISLAHLFQRALVIFRTVVIVIILSFLMIIGYVRATNSDLFLVKPETINVIGLRRVTRGEALRAAGLDKPKKLFSFDASNSMAALKSLPWIKSADLTRYIPDGVTIEVEEYEPKALAAIGNIYYIDELGHPFKMLDPGENPNLTIVSGFEVDELLIGGPLVLDGVGQVLRLMELLAARTDEFRLANVSEINYDPDRGITLFLLGGEMEIKMGAGAFAEKLIRLGRVAARLKLDGRLGDLEYLNLDSPPRVIGRWKNGRGRSGAQVAGAEVD